ncbi:unnamed protein product [Didymodactylos carnosus]|uniref:Uncharacterized protein n=1 Tax=Didymodactylos carnosus TaxID=1234261 RepID=A0A8S2QXX9_9BILA|nr:unnamed protein product [Didymodactylos carnosus]
MTSQAHRKQVSGQSLTSLPSTFNLRKELTDLLQNHETIKKQLAITITSTTTNSEIDLNPYLSKIVDLLEPALLERLNQRFKLLEEQISDMDDRLDEVERYNRSYNVRLMNVPYRKEEDAIQITRNIAHDIGFKLHYNEIETAHRIFLKSDTSSTSALPPVLIARLYSRPCRFQFLSYKQNFRKLPTYHPTRNTILSEDLSRKNAKIFTRARQQISKNDRSKLYTSNGCVLYRKDENECVYLKSLQDIEQLPTST